MGKGDVAVKRWMGRQDRFADLFNGTVFQGKQVILPEELEPADGEYDILLQDKNEKTQEIHRYRDMVMRWKKGAMLVLLACENQENIHYAMPDRNMVYDGLAYVGQIQQMWKREQNIGDNKEKLKGITSAEFLSKFRKGDSLIPVITLVFYYGEEDWDGSTDLYGMLQWSGEEAWDNTMKKYISNYKLNLIDAGNMEHLENFQTDLQIIFGMLKCRGNKEELIQYVNNKGTYFQNVDEETYQVIREFLHSEKILKKNIKKESGKETVDMCKALEDLYQEGVEQGIERGIEQGIEQGMERGMEWGLLQGTIETMKELEVSKEEAIERVEKKFAISREEAEKSVETYWK